MVDAVAAVPPTLRDTALAVVLTVPLLIDLARQEVPPGGPLRAADPLGFVLVALLILPLAVRRRYPIAVFSVILVDVIIVAALFYRPVSYGFGLIVATYTVAAHVPRPRSWVAHWLAQAFVIGIKLRAIAAGLDVGWFAWPLDMVYVGAGWYLGDTIQTRRRYADQLEHSREELARHAVIEERTNIARELHDAVGHAVSVMVVHAGAGERSIDSSPEKARRAFRAIGQVGRESLDDMDRLLGVLRSDETDGNALLRPSLANLPHLVDEFTDLGLDVTTTVVGTPSRLGPGVDQAAFRIVQEALTNTLKHAGPTRAEVTLRYGGDRLDVEVRDCGPRSGLTHRDPIERHGRGLTGMRERVEVQAGSLDLRRCPDGGFLVVARLPTNRSGS
jgi:signal transduction histidine kinase